MKRMSLDALLELANKVRKAGGGEMIEELLPGAPGAASSCVIAKNLNFDCQISPERSGPTRHSWMTGVGWVMRLQGFGVVEIGTKIVRETGWEIVDQYEGQYGGTSEIKLLLPPEVGKVAADYDRFWSMVRGDLAWSQTFIDEAKELWPLVLPQLREKVSAHGGPILERRVAELQTA